MGVEKVERVHKRVGLEVDIRIQYQMVSTSSRVNREIMTTSVPNVAMPRQHLVRDACAVEHFKSFRQVRQAAVVNELNLDSQTRTRCTHVVTCHAQAR